MSTYSAKPEDITHEWWIIDAKDLVTGRLAAKVATLLRGKHKPIFTPSMDCGDNVVIINADKVKFKGKKMTDKIYYRHTGHPGGIKSTNPETVLKGEFPERVFRAAVKNMLPSGPLARQQLKKLKVYAGSEHPHTAQNPTVIDFASENTKNS
ncbi:MAG: 50S ribosomal protein L13 [Rickettsiales bacterium]|nr:50S ribosomal protein L13 [Rickettsiales bacterium]